MHRHKPPTLPMRAVYPIFFSCASPSKGVFIPSSVSTDARKRQSLFVFCLLRRWAMPVALLMCLGLAFSAHAAMYSPFFAERGVLDLSGWDVARSDVKLDGEWEFYWRQFIDPAVFGSPDFSKTPSYMSLPGSWRKAQVDGKKLPSDGFGTLRLRLILAQETGPLGLYLPEVRSSYALWINGHPMTSQGAVSDDPVLARPRNEASFVVLDPSDPVLDLVLHVANFSFREGGVAQSIVLGDADRLVKGLLRSLAFEVFVLASLMVFGLYHLGIWTLRRYDRHALYFGLFCLVVAGRTAMMGQAPLLHFFTELPWEIQLKLEYLGFYLGLPLFILFLQSMYPEEMGRRFVSASVAICALFGLTVILTPARIHSHLLLYFEIVAVITFVYMTYALVRAIHRGREGSKPILIGAAVIFVVVIHDMFFFWGYLGGRALTPTAILAMVLAYSFTLSKRFSDEFNRQRILTKQNASLLQTVSRQVVQIRESRRLINEREEQTRRDLAEMLHGTVQSRLLSAHHHLLASIQSLKAVRSSSDPGLLKAERAIRKASEQIEMVSREDVREISHRLHPMLIQLGLLPALRLLCERFAGHFTVEFKVGEGFARHQDQLGEDGIDKPVRLGVYRVVEEALTNILKHAKATHVDIFLDVISEMYGVVVVRDNGTGSSDAATTRGLGQKMMVARIEELGGSLEIQSVSGEGTTVTIRVPFRPSMVHIAEDAGARPDPVEGDDPATDGKWRGTPAVP